jgi:hypothetical protein
MRRFLITAASAFGLLLAFSPTAYADVYAGAVYKTRKECNHDAIQRQTAGLAGRAGYNYYCKEVHHVPAGVAGYDSGSGPDVPHFSRSIWSPTWGWRRSAVDAGWDV